LPHQMNRPISLGAVPNEVNLGWSPITIDKNTNWSGSIIANKKQLRRSNFITVRCYLRIVKDPVVNKITHAYMYPMFVGKKFKAHGSEALTSNVTASKEIQGLIPDRHSEGRNNCGLCCRDTTTT
jgi:hypothetical protein